MQLVLCLMVASITEVIFEGTATTSNVTKFIVPRVTPLVIAPVPSACPPCLTSKRLSLFCSGFGEVTGGAAPRVCLLVNFYWLYETSTERQDNSFNLVCTEFFIRSFFGCFISVTDKHTFWPHSSSFPSPEPSLHEQLWFQRLLHSSFLFLLASCKNYFITHILPFDSFLSLTLIIIFFCPSFFLKNKQIIPYMHPQRPRPSQWILQCCSVSHQTPSQSSASALCLNPGNWCSYSRSLGMYLSFCSCLLFS